MRLASGAKSPAPDVGIGSGVPSPPSTGTVKS